MRALIDLTPNELRKLYEDGHLGKETKDIVELENFYNNVKNLLTILEQRESNKHIPVYGETYSLSTPKVNLMFKINDVLSIEDQKYITHMLNIHAIDLNKKNAISDGPKFYDKAEFGYSSIKNEIIYHDLETDEEYVAHRISNEVFESVETYHSTIIVE